MHHINDSPRSIYNIWSLHSGKTPGNLHRTVTDMLGLLHNLQASHLFRVAHMGRLLRRILSWALGGPAEVISLDFGVSGSILS